MENEIQNLTDKFAELCAGKNTGVVIGSALNIIMSSAQLIPDSKVRDGIAQGLRNIANSLEAQNGARQ